MHLYSKTRLPRYFTVGCWYLSVFSNILFNREYSSQKSTKRRRNGSQAARLKCQHFLLCRHGRDLKRTYLYGGKVMMLYAVHEYSKCRNGQILRQSLEIRGEPRKVLTSYGYTPDGHLALVNEVCDNVNVSQRSIHQVHCRLTYLFFRLTH